MESADADIVLWRRQGLCGSWLLPFVEHSVGLWNMEGVEGMIYRGYKIKESHNPNWGWNVYKWSMCANRWIWLWAYGSLYEAEIMIDAHLDAMEMEG